MFFYKNCQKWSNTEDKEKEQLEEEWKIKNLEQQKMIALLEEFYK